MTHFTKHTMFCGFSKQKKCFHDELNNIYRLEKIKKQEKRKKEKTLKSDEFSTKAGLWHIRFGKYGRSPVIKLVHSFIVMVSPNLPPLASLGAAVVKKSFPNSAVSHPRDCTYISLWSALI